MRDYAEQRAVAGAIRNVLTGTATTATATGKLAEGWWMVRAYDAEVYIAEGDLSGNWSDDRAARLDPNDQPISFLSDERVNRLTYRCASGGSVRFVFRQRS